MAKVKVLMAAALLCLPTLALQAADFAQQKPDIVAEEPSGVELRDRDTNRALLAALLERRAEIAKLSPGTAANRSALDFLDRRLAELSRRAGK